ncbi:MAG TPA: EamA family transporter [Bryobacteraceae bacterium]|nr:EamA family transporter [Bryobacteraceae bacterium]
MIGYDEQLPAVTSSLPSHNTRSIILVFCCTILGAAAQIFMKMGANTLAYPTVLQTILHIGTNVPLIAGYILYGISTLLLIVALKTGQLSVLYPIISLTYVWVTILSVIVFNESVNIYKAVGLAIIMLGVAVLGMDSRK